MQLGETLRGESIDEGHDDGVQVGLRDGDWQGDEAALLALKNVQKEIALNAGISITQHRFGAKIEDPHLFDSLNTETRVENIEDLEALFCRESRNLA